LAVLRFEHFIVEQGSDRKPLQLGHGAMGVTYQAVDTVLQRPVALKVIASHLIDNEALKNRFLREARAAASLRHPNIASVFYLGSTQQSYFYAMELLTGQTIEHLIATEGPLRVQQALEITAQVGSALAAAHEVGLIHRDIKPSNLIVSSDSLGRLNTKVIDFGLAKLNSESSEDSDPGVFLGTPRYASPEQFAGEPVDIRSDIYSLGITLWQMVTNTLPFSGSPSQIAVQHLQSRLPIDKLRDCPQPLVALLRQMLARNPRDRPQTPDALLKLVQETQEKLGPGEAAARVQRFGSRWPRPKLSRRWYLGGAALILLAGTGGLYLFLRPISSSGIEKSVAVLPFDSVGGDGQNDDLSDGLTSEVIFQLSKVTDLRVIARSSVLRYKTVPNAGRKDIREIGSELHVGAVLESSIQRAGNRLKLVTILYDSRNDRRLWGASYDRQLNDLFAIQSDLAENIAGALRAQLTPDEREKLENKPTENSGAYEKYLRGQALYHLNHKEDNEGAIALFREAVEVDPKFALAYAALANAYIERVSLFDQDESNLDLAVDFARRAVALDPNQARAYATLARALSFKDSDEEARKVNNKALQLGPNDFEPNRRAAYMAEVDGQFSRQYELLRKCHSIDPNDPYELFALGLTCMMARDHERADHWFKESIQVESDTVRRKILEANRLMFQGKLSDAEASLRGLPLELKAYGNTVLELLVTCAARLGDWNTVSDLATKRYQQGPGFWEWDQWALVYIALRARSLNDASEVQSAAEQISSLVHKTPGSAIDHWDAYYLAVADRFLGNNEEAYKYLKDVFRQATRHLPLMLDDPSLDVFRADESFRDLTMATERADLQLRKDIAAIDQQY
jgi:eukaryotic-like serine/threonine-protein kinase